MYSLLQLLLAVIAIYGALNFQGNTRLFVPLGCLVAMFITGRLDRERYEKQQARKDYLRSEMEKIAKKDAIGLKEQDSYITHSMLSPKGELVLIDAVHFIFKDLGFTIAPGGKYNSVDRIVKIPKSGLSFGVEVLMSDKEVEKSHPGVERALEFQREKKNKEKTLIIASTHVREPLSNRDRLNEISPDLHEFLAGCQITLMTAYSLYQLWQRSKAGEVDSVEVFRNVFFHPGGIFSQGALLQPPPRSEMTPPHSPQS